MMNIHKFTCRVGSACRNNFLKRHTKVGNGNLRWDTVNTVDRYASRVYCSQNIFNRPASSLKILGSIRQVSDSCPSNRSKYNEEDGSNVSNLKPVDLKEISDDCVNSLFTNDLLVYEDFISQEEEKSLLSEIEPYMKKLRYEYDHWDDAIHGYRETEKRHWNESNMSILQRVRDLAFPPDVPEDQLAYVHILDLEKNGYIKPHVDSVRFCGTTITGLSLLSDSVMKLVHVQNKDQWAKVLLKRRSLYIIRGAARYDYTHEILSDQLSYFRDQHVPRHRRISVMCRNEAADLTGFPDPPQTQQRYPPPEPHH